MAALFPRLLLTAFTLLAGSALAADEGIARRAEPCVTCHGKEGRATADGYYPRIAGKPAGYLYNQLRNFRDGRRQQYPLMTYLVQHLSDDYLKEFAEHFAAQHPPYPPPQPVQASAAVLERGRLLASQGDPARDIPACMACHGKALTGVVPAMPGLLGLPRDYLLGQFGAWREGARHAAAPDCMAEITRQLSLEDINAVSSWLAAQPVPPGARPAPSLPGRLPIACGSVPQ
ncbi:MAG TPA: cytochrome c4 [Noviherbaspirillum sp.]|uniref:c-type cytochrome n=1 Tax=Noviherbaspirillum sp. TaxID=1926288 RepID=UPI002D4E54EC|nr:cytochrome c4 [Noviherbaspirillum sp.]HYD96786.1 cytochrome c4 [Noviherbaspirillum sp.]